MILSCVSHRTGTDSKLHRERPICKEIFTSGAREDRAYTMDSIFFNGLSPTAFLT